MPRNSSNHYVIPIAVTLLVASVPFGLFPWAFLSLVGFATIQAGLHGFQPAGYGTVGQLKLSGRFAQVLGAIVIFRANER